MQYINPDLNLHNELINKFNELQTNNRLFI